ncbi:MAG: rRNA maturation RNase YbeY [Bacteroidota bacterium]
MAIRFNFQKHVRLSNRRVLKEFLKGIFLKEGIQLGDLEYVFCDDNYILNVNQTFLQHDYFTDIITFDMTEPGSKFISGEIYISVDTVTTNAIKFQTSFINELHRVMFHGVLHLCGYNDKSEKEKRAMRGKENHYLAMFHGKH